jgi:hypothetical protein
MATKLATRFLEESEYPAWNDLVAKAEEGSIYATPEYLDVLSGETGGRFRILVADRGGEIAGGIALYERTSSWGRYATSRLLLYYHGIVLAPHRSKYPSERTARTIETLTALEQALSALGWGRLQIKSRAPLSDMRVFFDRGWVAEPSYTYVAPIGDLDALWQRMEQNLRRLVTRCTRDGVEFTEDDDFENFYRLHEQTHVRKGASLYLPEARFRRYFERLRSSNLCRLFQARMPDGRVASTQLVLLGRHPVCHTVSAAADPDLQKTGATAFLRWKTFQWLSERGFKANDLTDAQLNSVTHFKSQLGGELELVLVLSRPDRGRFRIQNWIHNSGSAIKRTLRSVVAGRQREGR